MSFGASAVSVLRELVVVVVGAVIVAALLRALVGQMFIIPSVSMQETLQVGDRVLVEKLSTVQRGQIVVFENPGGWLNDSLMVERGPVGRALEFVGVLPDTGTEHLIKRVVGLPGDRVVCCDPRGRISVNDQPLEESAYVRAGGSAAPVASTIRFDVTVPADRVFVLGDNRPASRDSRCHLNDGNGTARGENAFVPMDLVVGRAIAVVWPAADVGRLRTPSTYATVPPGRGAGPVEPEVEAGPEAAC